MMPRLRSRHVAIATVLLLWIYFYLPRDETFSHVFSSSPSGASHGGTHTLSRYMNDPTHIPPISAQNSSFDWSSVSFTYPPKLTPKLPAPVTKRPRIQHKFKPESAKAAAVREKRRLEVKRVLEKAWGSYRTRAWMKDVLKPLSGFSGDQFSGWAATLVDSLDTLWIAGMRDEFYEAVQACSDH